MAGWCGAAANVLRQLTDAASLPLDAGTSEKISPRDTPRKSSSLGTSNVGVGQFDNLPRLRGWFKEKSFYINDLAQVAWFLLNLFQLRHFVACIQ
jgi:hypothetical protein